MIIVHRLVGKIEDLVDKIALEVKKYEVETELEIFSAST
jgi:hypothetical protein